MIRGVRLESEQHVFPSDVDEFERFISCFDVFLGDESWIVLSIGSSTIPISTKPNDIASDDISRLKNDIYNNRIRIE